MFKFMKSKKGFSLVELMIVVVIMAILVAVAVPIFNSVTGNSRAKTCIDNQRSIISTLNTALLEKTVVDASAQTFYVVNIKSSGTKGYYSECSVSNAVVTFTTQLADNATGVLFNGAELKKLFQTAPYCPVDDSAIKVVIDGNADGTASITTECLTNGVNSGVTEDVHKLS